MLFVVGKPGCGKSGMIRGLIGPLVRASQLFPIRFNDYEILKEMFLKDEKEAEEKKRFEAAPHGGFTILKNHFEVFDEALQQLENAVVSEMHNRIQTLPKPPFALIEFARNDYKQAFNMFHDEFLQSSWFIYLDTDIPTCKQRILERINKPRYRKTDDDYFVSEAIFKTYYTQEKDIDLFEVLQDHGVERERGLVVENNQKLKITSSAPQQNKKWESATSASRKISSFLRPILKRYDAVETLARLEGLRMRNTNQPQPEEVAVV